MRHFEKVVLIYVGKIFDRLTRSNVVCQSPSCSITVFYMHTYLCEVNSIIKAVSMCNTLVGGAPGHGTV